MNQNDRFFLPSGLKGEHCFAKPNLALIFSSLTASAEASLSSGKNEVLLAESRLPRALKECLSLFQILKKASVHTCQKLPGFEN